MAFFTCSLQANFYQKNLCKIRETLFTFKLCSSELLSFLTSIIANLVLKFIFPFSELFEDWLLKDVLPHLDPNSVLVFDNASYHRYVHQCTLFKNCSKCRIWFFLILAFFTNVCPIKTDLSGNTVWPQASVFQKLAEMDHFWHF